MFQYLQTCKQPNGGFNLHIYKICPSVCLRFVKWWTVYKIYKVYVLCNLNMCHPNGPSIYDVHKSRIFDSPPVHTSQTPSSPCGRPSGPKTEIRLYDCNLFKTVLLIILLLIYIAEKFPLFIPSKDEIVIKRMSTSLHKKKTGWHQWTLILIFCVDVHMGLDPSQPRPHASAWAWPPPPPCGHHKWIAPNVLNESMMAGVYMWIF